MGDYKSESIKGWQRSCAAVIDNAYGKTPTITFSEEMIVVENGVQVFQRDIGGVREEFSDPSVAFPLLNPTDDTVAGEATYGQIYALLYSLYRHLADKRDTAAEAAASS